MIQSAYTYKKNNNNSKCLHATKISMFVLSNNYLPVELLR